MFLSSAHPFTPRRWARPSAAAAGVAALLVCACGTGTGTDTPALETEAGTGPSLSGAQENDGDIVVSPPGKCGPHHLTAACTCPEQDNIPGAKTCLNGAWSACRCMPAAVGSEGGGEVDTPADGPPVAAPSEPPGNRSPHRFDWERTPLEMGSCKAGHYVGNFVGTYASPVVFTVPVPVEGAAGLDGKPGLEFWLERVAGTGEVFRLNKGIMRGTANGMFPFTISMTGDLDCKTKKFTGKLEDGKYAVLTLEYEFSGDTTSDYDKVQNKFINGVWTCAEEPDPNWPFPAGGEGTWDATWVGPEGPP